MRAFLLCAGKGTRLGPMTRNRPKCLIEVGGQSMLYRWLRALEEVGVEEVLVNLHHRPEQIEEAVSQYPGGTNSGSRTLRRSRPSALK